MVKFCPRCGGPLVPVKKDDEVVLKCNRCGYEAKTDVKKERYGVKYQVDASKRVVTAQATEAKEAKLSPEEREILREYYEVLLEELEQEESESEESD
ncbi:DNA-directed RNA polymerase subunit M [Desulfurococcus mucosus]|uniref:DNA-directed RNA polymerase, subunit M n=1 Tax=Desulfurococcus mucosus (strain ATCC 35584 / DSM 2162 / JCM 9187 / O7/1) TaxID=765177 RepID=E8R772_DESM0|nr:DNA-directed RNA polymerase subunit M [Desulfurococcus mucosus]ADV65537.1 DNA-directed RNA polymerase, subunit M [Desulfurococcus mucosus DSM 2162]